MNTQDDTCRFCGGSVPAHSLKCRHCGEWLDPENFISVVNSTGGYQALERAIATSVKESVQERQRNLLTITIPVFLFLLGGAGLLLVKAAITDSIDEPLRDADEKLDLVEERINDARLTMKRAEFVVENAGAAIDRVNKANLALEELQGSLGQLRSDRDGIAEEMNNIAGNLQRLRQESQDIAKGNFEKSKAQEKRVDDIVGALQQIEKRVAEIEAGDNGSRGPAVASSTASLESRSSEEQQSKDRLLERQIALISYTVQVGRHAGLEMPTDAILQTLLRNGFSAIPHDFRNAPTSEESYRTIVVGKEIPNEVLEDFFQILREWKEAFAFVRFNSHASHDTKVFIGSNDESSEENCHSKLSSDLWDDLIEKPRSTIRSLTSAGCSDDKDST